ncbi:hypothetical protein BAUCODRAFT_38445 [Baudoinia panamericana UAMH 10762]|uniref:Uncharacterized protein n=1 Tax=Baudoinia panamericana (strain UAMH 10762) TaxID=717646 RepID=M2LEG0_BAUPA|nr:uncharacterized protein BAUCODRAFT_38445 [Baudoinia panamericana UAMH 10762]EMC92392.1 hypothetical protein BAUCODRAFT_38445 [Baudoinia panamericana UAMH 10762]
MAMSSLGDNVAVRTTKDLYGTIALSLLWHNTHTTVHSFNKVGLQPGGNGFLLASHPYLNQPLFALSPFRSTKSPLRFQRNLSLILNTSLAFR